MTYEEKYPNIAKLSALLNQQKHPRKTLNALINLLSPNGQKAEGGAGMTSREECISLIMSLTPEERRQLLAMWKEQRNERLSAQINTGTTES